MTMKHSSQQDSACTTQEIIIALLACLDSKNQGLHMREKLLAVLNKISTGITFSSSQNHELQTSALNRSLTGTTTSNEEDPTSLGIAGRLARSAFEMLNPL